jgi:hypothetical protein
MNLHTNNDKMQQYLLDTASIFLKTKQKFIHIINQECTVRCDEVWHKKAIITGIEVRAGIVQKGWIEINSKEDLIKHDIRHGVMKVALFATYISSGFCEQIFLDKLLELNPQYRQEYDNYKVQMH